MDISCVIPCYNGERFLGAALDSAFAQTLPPAEVIVVDDGSTDATADVAANYGSRVTYLRQDNAGPAAARNRGLACAQCDFIAFLDADDLWHQDKLARQAVRFEARPELDISVTHLRAFWELEVRHEQDALAGHARTREAVPGYVLQTLLARRAVFANVGTLNPALRFGEDTDWFIRARDAGAEIELMPDVLVSRRFHLNNLTRSRGNAVLRSGILAMIQTSLERRRKSASDSSSQHKLGDEA
jgi:glycosyltransferase involved in cell wall biosynthesis